MVGTVREQQAKLLEAGYKPTGFTAMDGRFEVIRQPAGAYGSKVTWNVWDYGADGCGDWVQIYGIKTLQQAKARLAEYAERRLKGEVTEEVHYANHDHYAAWLDTAGVWYTPAECKAAAGS